MNINIKITGIESTSAISDYALKKISSVQKYLPEASFPDAVAQVEIGKSTRHHKSGDVFRAEVHITGPNLNLYAESETNDLYSAIDTVRDEIIRNVVQLKGKRETVTRRGAEMMKNMMKGLSDSTVRGFRWGFERLRLKKFKGFRKRP